ncbi:MAG: hypothetical protein ACRC0G_12605, partial [Fusobacteriaceae bacterium]
RVSRAIRRVGNFVGDVVTGGSFTQKEIAEEEARREREAVEKQAQLEKEAREQERLAKEAEDKKNADEAAYQKKMEAEKNNVLNNKKEDDTTGTGLGDVSTTVDKDKKKKTGSLATVLRGK